MQILDIQEYFIKIIIINILFLIIFLIIIINAKVQFLHTIYEY